MDETLPSLATIIENLARAQSELLCAAAADAVPAARWKMRPAEGRWSAGELVGHRSAIERAILSRAGKLLQKPPESVPFFKRFHVPMMFVEARVIRRKAPVTLEPKVAREKEEMQAELRGVRERTLAFIEETRGRDLSKYRMAHPFLGSLNAYQWLQFLAAHEKRHMNSREATENRNKFA